MHSLRARLITVAAVWVVLGVAVAGIVLSAEFKNFLVGQFSHEIQEHLDEVEGLIAIDGRGKVEVQRALSDPRFSIPLSGYYWEVQRNGEIAARSNSLEGPMLKVPVDGGSDTQVHNHSIAGPTGELLIAERLRWLNGEKEPIRIILGTDRRLLNEVLAEFNKTLLWSLGIFSLLMIVVAGLLLIYAIAPIGRLRAAFADYRSGVTPDMRGRFPDEVQPLIDDLNTHIAASEEQMQRARAQAGNIAHGLKTPLAILVDEAHRLSQKGESQSAAVMLDQCRRMQGQIDYQIARARAAASRMRPGTISSLTDTTASVVRALERLHIDRALRIENEIPADVKVACETQDLNEMLANIIDNACKHASSTVLLRLGADGKRDFVTVIVEDDGPGLPPEAWSVVFNIGEQWDSKAGGSGLGLPIVRDLAQLYGGSIRLDQSTLGGLKVILTLPAQP
ncbi:MAG: HAMP domain-containing sensor histidine kinase [Hyphomicrobium sp.]|jgi:signal transduction histidine kinase